MPQQKHLELQIDGAREAVSPTLSLPPGGSLKHEFRFTLDREGVHRGEVRLVEEDGSPLDNRLYFAVTVDQQIPVAIVKPRRDEVPQADDAFYLERALAPGGSGRRRLPDHDAHARVAGHRRPLGPGRRLLRQPPRPRPARGGEAARLRSGRRATSSGSAGRTSSRWPTTR